MSYRHIFDPVAAKEYEDAFKWYEERSFFAADNFILSVENAISHLRKSLPIPEYI